MSSDQLAFYILPSGPYLKILPEGVSCHFESTLCVFHPEKAGEKTILHKLQGETIFHSVCAAYFVKTKYLKWNISENGGEGGRGSAQKGVIKASKRRKISCKVST